MIGFDIDGLTDDPDATWAQFTREVSQIVEEYGQLTPPPELAEFHEANLDGWKTLRDAASERPGSDSFGDDLDSFSNVIVDEWLPLAADPSRTDEENDRLLQEILERELPKLFGHNAYQSDIAAQDALESLSHQNRVVLEIMECLPFMSFAEFESSGDIPSSDNPILEIERTALIELYVATDGPNWKEQTNWLSDAPLGEWYGVRTRPDGRVDRLVLDSNWLNGEIPVQIGDLTSLELLDLAHNQLYGGIPPELGNLYSLKVLHLRSNNLTGELPPELGNLDSLGSMNVFENMLSGAIPRELGKLDELAYLKLNSNEFSGMIPPELGNLANLNQLWLHNNQLTGEIPPELGNLANLTALALSRNQLSGNIPPELANLAHLGQLGLNRNRLSGEIPPELVSLTNLTSVSIYQNNLTGCIPEDWRDMITDNTRRWQSDGSPTGLFLPFCE